MSLSVLLLLVLAPAPSEVTLRLLDGSELPVTSLSLADGGGLTVRAGGESRTVPVDDVLVATVGGAAERSALETDVAVLLVDGSRLTGRLGEGDVDLLRLETASLGEVALPIDRVRAVTFGPEGDRLDPASLAGRASEDDLVFRRGPVEGDVVEGTVTSVDGRGVEIDADLGRLSLELDEVLGIAVAVFEDEAPARERPVDVELRDGGLLRGELEDLSSGRLRVAVGWDRSLAVDLSRIAALRFGSERFAWLSDLPPATVEETPFLGGPDDFLFPWRRDRTVTGGDLVVGGVRYGKGLGLHSRTRLTWNLDGAYARLDAKVGVADEVLAHDVTGSVVIRIVVDDEVRFESETLHAGRPATPVRVDLSGAETLRLEVDFADRGDVGDRAVVGEPVLVLAGG